MNTLAPVIYAEDTEDDVFLMRRAFTKAQVPNPLVIASNGYEIIRYLEGLVGHPSARPSTPCLVMLDVKMPYYGGTYVLKWIRLHPQFRDLPTIMFSSSSQTRDIRISKEFGANAYIVKPSSIDDLRQLVEAIGALCVTPPDSDKWLTLPGSISPSED